MEYKTLRVQLTERCNLGCLFCCHEGTKADYSILNDRNIATFIMACKDCLKIERVKFTGGEPLIHEKDGGSIFNIIRLVNEKYCSDIKFSVVTNGSVRVPRDITDSLTSWIENPNLDVTLSLPVPPKIEYFELYHNLTCRGSRNNFQNLCNAFSLASSYTRKKTKINYVLCKGVNDSVEIITEMINLALHSKGSIVLRFLETATNRTNNNEGQLQKYVVSSTDFDSLLHQTPYNIECLSNTRSHKLYRVSRANYETEIKLIKFFCSNECMQCPNDKTSIWLTPDGFVKNCSYHHISEEIKEWTYRKLYQLLYDSFGSN